MAVCLLHWESVSYNVSIETNPWKATYCVWEAWRDLKGQWSALSIYLNNNTYLPTYLVLCALLQIGLRLTKATLVVYRLFSFSTTKAPTRWFFSFSVYLLILIALSCLGLFYPQLSISRGCHVVTGILSPISFGSRPFTVVTPAWKESLVLAFSYQVFDYLKKNLTRSFTLA